MYDMLRNMEPPLGFGNKCPYRLAYKKLIRMNMPLTEDGRVNFTSTLFALIRENLLIKMRNAEEMDQADKELRVTIQKLWPLQADKVTDKLVPPDSGNCHSVLSVSSHAGFLFLTHLSGFFPVSLFSVYSNVRRQPEGFWNYQLEKISIQFRHPFFRTADRKTNCR